MHYVTVLKQDRNSVEFDLIKPGQIRIFKKKQGKKVREEKDQRPNCPGQF